MDHQDNLCATQHNMHLMEWLSLRTGGYYVLYILTCTKKTPFVGDIVCKVHNKSSHCSSHKWMRHFQFSLFLVKIYEGGVVFPSKNTNNLQSVFKKNRKYQALKLSPNVISRRHIHLMWYVVNGTFFILLYTCDAMSFFRSVNFHTIPPTHTASHLLTNISHQMSLNARFLCICAWILRRQ